MPLSANEPIGVFDSGLGGLTVLKALKNRLPNENYIYLGDTARLPYGSKSPETIREYLRQNIKYLKTHHVKAIVVACNSASTVLNPDEFTQIPVIGAIQVSAAAALKVSPNKRIGVIGTRATIESEAYAKALHSVGPEVLVFEQACPLFVPIVEEGLENDPLTNLLVYRYVHPVVGKGIDSLILGCTHYPVLKEALRKVVGPQIELVESGQAMAIDLEKKIVKSSSAHEGEIHICLTDLTRHTEKTARRILGSGFSSLAKIDL